MLTTAWRLRDAYGLAQVDVYSGPAFYWAAAVCGLLRALGKPYVLTLHGGNLPAFSSRRHWLVHKLLGSADAVTSPSSYLSAEMRAFRHDIQVLPNAISLSQYPFVARDASDQRLVWIRAFHHIYEPQLAVRVVAELTARFPKLSLTMVGPDKGDGSLQSTQALARQLGVEDKIRFVGKVPKDEIAVWINSADIFLNTSTIDNSPVTVIEAMACGACVVTTEVGGIPYLCNHRVDAMLSPVSDVKAMASNISQLLSQPKLAQTLSRNSRSRVELMDWAAILPRWTSLLRFVSNRATSRGSKVNS
jgi:glycosyltransferase involved in cell wall biosynthesis